jgi:hypothetical protein
MKIFSRLILSISLLNFSASAMEISDVDTTNVTTTVRKQLNADIVNPKKSS